MSKRRIGLLFVLGTVVATTLVLALNVTAYAQVGYGAPGAPGTPATGIDLALFAVAGAGMIGAGYLLARRSRA
ncbi:MAG: LPXTG cell wall anchor domain-containing protein [Thermoleophilia bacterium]|nr:LPXTG cell wall anchor domain-containing protein [Thermoleophilia bacterium]